MMNKTIKVEEKTHNRLKKKGKKGEPFDKIINDILDENVKLRKQVKQK